MTVELPELEPSIPPWPGEHVELGELRLHVRVTPGGAEKAVYLHGLGGSATNWTDLAAQLAGRVTGYAPDLPGFGNTEPPRDWPFTAAAQAELAAEFIASLDAGPVHLVGNSLGGTTAILLAARHPELVHTLTLISPAVPDLRPDIRRLSDPRLLLTGLPVVGKPVRRQLAALSPRERTMRLLRLVFARPEEIPEHRIQEAMREAAERARQPWAGAALMRAGAELFRLWFRRGKGSVWAALRQVSAPVLVVWGREDKLVTVAKAVPTVRALPRGRLLVLDRVGHVAQMEEPATVARAILDMWDSAAGSS
ncbi:alpha/beta fold hydrolase [Sciscionella sediminilitoris]|uniref:alpha/beta fold hydrolase n=1 Tax=Sciscionella sediminilitoris TaxID=1445613 RepID=UPI0004DFB8C1|nr:alpha/beta fold hydrolase [Sciscionella sp. SE31]